MIWRPTRRGVLRSAAALGATGLAGGAYALGVEPMRLRVQRWAVSPGPAAPWPAGLRLRIVALADIHACRPYMSPDRIRGIADAAMALEPDLLVLLGDYVAGTRMAPVASAEWAAALAPLRAPLGVYAILGNHDWWDDRGAQRTGELPIAGRALVESGIRLLHNQALELRTTGGSVWLAGLGDQLAFWPSRRREPKRRIGTDDLAGTLSAIPAGAPTILLAHEPDIFPKVPPSVALTLSGHTHGGQVRAFGYSPIVPSRYGNRFAYGHVREQGDLVVSGGLGCSIWPVRFGVPPEITAVEIGKP